MSETARPVVKSYRDLIVWQKSMALVKETYRFAELLPKREIYGLVAQIRRAAISIPANIAEGHARHTTRDYIRFLAIATGSLREVQTYCDACAVLEYATEAQLARVRELAADTGMLLSRLCAALRRRSMP